MSERLLRWVGFHPELRTTHAEGKEPGVKFHGAPRQGLLAAPVARSTLQRFGSMTADA